MRSVAENELPRTEVVTFGNSAKEITENFLISKVGIDKDGTLFGGLTESEYDKRSQKDSLEVDFLKMRLAEIDLDKYLSLTKEDEEKLSQGKKLLEIVESKSGLDKFEKSQGDTTLFFGQLPHWQKINLNEVEYIEILSAYFLAKVIVRTKDWFVNKYQRELDVDNLNWCVNLGAPVQYLDSLSNARFEKVLLLARLLCEDEKQLDSLKLPDLQSLCQKLKPQLKEDIQNQDIRYKVTSEVAAGAFAYATSNQAQNGYLLYVDIGGGTTEFCYFYYQKQGSNVPEINCQNAFAPILGIDAIIHDVQLESNLDRQTIQSQLIDPDTSIVEDLDRLIIKSQKPLKQGETIAAVAKKQHQVVMANNYDNNHYYYITQEAIESKLKTSHTSQEKMLYELMLWERAIHLYTACKPQEQILVGGGGKDSVFFRHCIQSTYSAFKQFNKPSTFQPKHYEIKEVSSGVKIDKNNFDMNGVNPKHFHRFAIAFGLSIPKELTLSFKLPSQNSIPPMPPIEESKKPVSKVIFDAIRVVTAK